MRVKLLATSAVLVSVLSAVLSQSPSAVAAGPPTFSATLVSPQELTGEPSIAVDGNTLYYTAPNLDAVLRSTDGGAHWSKFTATSTEGDADVAVDAAHTVYLSGLLGGGTLNTTIPVSASTDQGTTWIRAQSLAPDSTGIVCDREWTVATTANHVVHTARCNGEVAWVSNDGGQTFTGPITIDVNAGQSGPPVATSTGTLFVGYIANGMVKVAKSTNGGTSWTATTIGAAGGSVMFWPSIAVDDAGNPYVSWAAGTSVGAAGLRVSENGHVVFSRSIDGGATWLPITTISAPNAVAVFPWVAAGAAGKIDIAYYASTNAPVGPDIGSPTTTWDILVAQSLDATSAAPTFTTTTAIAGFHTGSVCTSGLTCLGTQSQGLGNLPTPLDRRVLDFFETAVTADGSLLIAFPKDRPIIADDGSITVGDTFLSWIDLMVATQTGGTKLRP
jgi:hypothetical protein